MIMDSGDHRAHVRSQHARQHAVATAIVMAMAAHVTKALAVMTAVMLSLLALPRAAAMGGASPGGANVTTASVVRRAA